MRAALIIILCLVVVPYWALAVSPIPSEDTGEASAADRFRAAGISNAETVICALAELKELAATEDFNALSRLVRTPIMVFINGKKTILKSQREVIQSAPDVFNARILQAIKGQEVDLLFANWQGVRIGNGELWLNEVDGEVLITSINNYQTP